MFASSILSLVNARCISILINPCCYYFYLYQGKKDLARMDVEDEDAYDSVDEMLNTGPQSAELDDSDFDPELDRRR